MIVVGQSLMLLMSGKKKVLRGLKKKLIQKNAKGFIARVRRRYPGTASLRDTSSERSITSRVFVFTFKLSEPELPLDVMDLSELVSCREAVPGLRRRIFAMDPLEFYFINFFFDPSRPFLSRDWQARRGWFFCLFLDVWELLDGWEVKE